MTLKDQVLAQALLLAGELDSSQRELLGVLCAASTASLAGRLREGLAPEDCKADFIAAASLFALSAMGSVKDADKVEQFRIGDVTVQKGRRDAASNCLRNQAELMIAPYLKDRFTFQGV